MDISSWWFPIMILLICAAGAVAFWVGIAGEREMLDDDVKENLTIFGGIGIVLSLIAESVCYANQCGPHICVFWAILLGAALFMFMLGLGLYVGPVTRR